MTDSRVIVAGAGPAGLVAALAFARRGLEVTLVGRQPPPADGRTVALFAGSVRILDSLGAWRSLAGQAAPMRRLRIIDDTDNLFRWRPVTFEADEIGLEAFGWNVEADALSRALRHLVEAQPGIRIREGVFAEPRFDRGEAGIAVDGDGLTAALLVAADGQRSQLRAAAGIGARLENLPQAALTAILAHELPHGDISTEFHRRGGPCTLVPLSPPLRHGATGGQDAATGHRSSVVWMLPQAKATLIGKLDDEAFALAVERGVHSILGKMSLAGPRGEVPLARLHVERLAGSRLALIGEAAHAFPPIGAQGLNLGLRDVQVLADLLGEALRRGRDIGEAQLLQDYQRARSGDVASREAIVAAMNRSLLSSFLPFDLARGLGMAALDLVGPLRRLVMREGVAPGFRP